SSLAGNEYTLRPGGLAGGEQYRIKVIASDGVNTAEVVSTANFRVNSDTRENEARPTATKGIGISPGVLVISILIAICITGGATGYAMGKKKNIRK
ncbi:MAG: hypothetical protein LUQ69_01155, partial [Methanoregulaceae archaeon]|nr:hypothetical protein [Methanoregulaceae archaeon]